jgi:hypothetical protein
MNTSSNFFNLFLLVGIHVLQKAEHQNMLFGPFGQGAPCKRTELLLYQDVGHAVKIK